MIPQYSWSPGEAASINEFLSTPLGTKWLGYLMFLKPPFERGNYELAALSGSYRAGYEQCLGAIQYTRQSQVPSDSGSAKNVDMTKD